MQESKNTRRNLFSNVITLIINVVIGVIYTPYLVKNLGVVAYGIVPLTLIINQYVNVLTLSLTNAFTRYYSIALQRNELRKASSILSSSFVAICCIILFCTPFVVWLIYKLEFVFQIDSAYITSARGLFVFTVLGFYSSLISSLLSVTLYAINRLDLINITKNVRNISRYVFVLLFFSLFASDVVYVGIANLITELVVLGISLVLFFRYRSEGIHVNLKLFNKILLLQILALAIWTILQKVGDVLLYNMDSVIVNMRWGLEYSGRIGAINEFGNYIIIITNVLGSLFGPVILMEYANNNHVRVKQLMVNQSLIVGALAAIMAGVLAGVSKDFLGLWLGKDFESYNSWLMIKLMSIPFSAAGFILAFTYVAWNKNRLPAICTLILGIINILVMLFVANNVVMKNVVFVMLCFECVFCIVQSYILNSYCVIKIYPEIKKALIFNMLKICLIIFFAFGVTIVVSKFVLLNSLFSLVSVVLLLGGLLLVCVYCFVFGTDSKKEFLRLIK